MLAWICEEPGYPDWVQIVPFGNVLRHGDDNGAAYVCRKPFEAFFPALEVGACAMLVDVQIERCLHPEPHNLMALLSELNTAKLRIATLEKKLAAFKKL